MSDDSLLRDPHVPVLIVTGGPRDGASLEVDTQGFEKVLGSGADCHLRVEAQNVDFHHARVLWDERGVVLSDEGSSTGTYVNGERIGADHPLEDGDRICLGPPGSRNTVKLLIRVPAEIADAQTVGFTAPAFLQPIEIDEMEAVPPALTVPDLPAPVVLEPEPEIALEAPIVFEEPPVAFEEPPVVFEEPPAFEAAPVEFAPENEANTIAFDAPSHEMFVPDEAPVPTRRLPTAQDEPFVPTMRLPPRPEPAPEPVAAAPPPPPPARPAPEPPPLPSITKPRPKPEYAPELPSIAVVRSEEPADEEDAAPPAEAPLRRLKKKPAAKATRTKRPGGGTVGKPVVLGGVLALALVVAGTLWFLRAPAETTTATGGPAAKPADEGPPGAPHIASIEPEAAMPGREVVLTGANLAGPTVKISIGGVDAAPIESTATRVRILVPKLPIVVEGQPVPVVVRAGAVRSRPVDLFLGRLPLVSDVAPRAGVPGDRVVVKGRGFDASASGNRVSFGDDPALVVGATASELTVIVPAPKSSLNRVDAPVVVKRGASSSSDATIFNITRPPAGIYKLKFFGAAVEGDATSDQAFVATELGPLLLVSGRGTHETVGARATAVANALNALVGQSPRFEVRSGYAVGAVGRLDPVVVATPVDAAAYAKALDPVMAGQAAQATATVVSGFWVALLQDTFTLFEKGGRPGLVMELSPRGKALMDLYAESERKVGAGVGVPTSLVSPPTWTLAKGFREMALALPSRGGAVAAAAVVGSWNGTIEETGAPQRSVRMVLRLEGSRLVGSMTTNAGGIDMNAALGDVTYANGVLSFTMAGGQAPRRFQGRVNGTQLEGTLQAGAGAPTGRIRLRYLE